MKSGNVHAEPSHTICASNLDSNAATWCNRHIFDRSGLATLSDLHTAEWHELFQHLEEQQSQFRAKELLFRSPEYRWPRDPLYDWSRVWEYPYVYYHLRKWRASLSDQAHPKVVDFGSGVTFFPFALARLGYHVMCTDVDPVCRADMNRAISSLDAGPGDVDFKLSSEYALALPDCEADAVYCISVIEHIPHFESAITEIARILKPGGLLVLTIDLDMRGDQGIGCDDYYVLTRLLRDYFHYRCAVTSVHPKNMLRCTNGPYALKRPPWGRFFLKEGLRRLMGRPRRYHLPYDLTVEGFVMLRRDVIASDGRPSGKTMQ